MLAIPSQTHMRTILLEYQTLNWETPEAIVTQGNLIKMTNVPGMVFTYLYPGTNKELTIYF